MEHKLELFSSIEELEKFYNQNFNDIASYINHIHNSTTTDPMTLNICFKTTNPPLSKLINSVINKYESINNFQYYMGLNDYLENKKRLFRQNFEEESLMSYLYTANFLKYSHLSINALDLFYCSREDNIKNPCTIKWINSCIESEKIFSKRDKKQLNNGQSTKWKKRLEESSEKIILKNLLQYNKVNNTIPYFLFELTYFVLFTCTQERGITTNNFKPNAFSSFYDELLDEIDTNINDKYKNLLMKYKAEKFFCPWVISSYKALLNTQYKYEYYTYYDWSDILTSYSLHLPSQFIIYFIDCICIALFTDSHNRYSIKKEQIENFIKTFKECIIDTKKLFELFLLIKKYHFYALYSQSKNLDDIIDYCQNKLNSLSLKPYTYKNFKGIEDESNKEINFLYSKIHNYSQTCFLENLPEDKLVNIKKTRISDKLPKDVLLLFNKL